jgi:cell fate (sporulation/competence/biofilm development) regulator YlbF (YheA/YmcA/DUF963 family)
MSAIAQNETIQLKTRELCQAILEEPSVKDVRLRIDQFMINDDAKSQYEKVVAQGQALQEKQQKSLPLSGEEISAFEADRDKLMKNPVASAFFEAQEDMHHLQKAIQEFVGKTLELGRLPTEEDLQGSCGHGCGCEH